MKCRGIVKGIWGELELRERLADIIRNTVCSYKNIYVKVKIFYKSKIKQNKKPLNNDNSKKTGAGFGQGSRLIRIYSKFRKWSV